MLILFRIENDRERKNVVYHVICHLFHFIAQSHIVYVQPPRVQLNWLVYLQYSLINSKLVNLHSVEFMRAHIMGVCCSKHIMCVGCVIASRAMISVTVILTHNKCSIRFPVKWCFNFFCFFFVFCLQSI